LKSAENISGHEIEFARANTGSWDTPRESDGGSSNLKKSRIYQIKARARKGESQFWETFFSSTRRANFAT
jgi:hypothetical protein